MKDKKALLEVENLTISLKEKDKYFDIVRGVSFHISEGEVFGIAGESGSGKTLTSLSLLKLIYPPLFIRDGSIVFNGKDITILSEDDMREIRGKEISMIFQEPQAALNPVFTIGYQMSEVLEVHLGYSKKEALKRSAELLREVRIQEPEKRLKSYPFELSGGMAQRVLIAMAISTNPKILIADEPTTALDVTVSLQILKLLIELKERFKMSILFVTHDLGLLYHIADRIGIMYAGEFLEIGDSESIVLEPKHPYTKALLKAVPSIHRDVKRLEHIDGTVISFKEYSGGCPFANRCKDAMDRCFKEKPEFVEISPNRKVKCFLYY